MKQTEDQKVSTLVCFTEQTPKISIGQEPVNPLYEAAFLNRNEKNDCEYCLNTAAWD